MADLTQRQRQILEFIQTSQSSGLSPSLREIARHFKFKSMTAVADHLKALRRKGVIQSDHRRARSLRIVTPLQQFRRPVAEIPVFGSIPAGPPADCVQDAKGCISVDTATLGLKPSTTLFALEVRGDSMIGKHIMDGDFVILDHGRSPRTGDVVAALIDGESTLKTFVVEQGRPFLKAENPRYSKLTPATELIVQGVMVGLIRRRRR